MQRSPLAAVALAVLLVTAGCNGLALGGDGTAEPTPTDGAADSIPGVENGQVTNATALLAAHDRGLVDAGFENEVRVNATIVQRNRTVDIQRRQRTIVEAGGGEFRYQTINGGDSGSVQFDHWGNDSVWVVRGQAGNTTDIQVRQQPPSTESLTGTALLRHYVAGSNASVVNVSEKDGLTLVTFETTALPSSGLPANGSDIRDYRARFVVDTQGRIHGLVVEGTYDLRGEARTFEVRYDLKRLDGPSISQPDWAQQALRNQNSSA